MAKYIKEQVIEDIQCKLLLHGGVVAFLSLLYGASRFESHSDMGFFHTL